MRGNKGRWRDNASREDLDNLRYSLFCPHPTFLSRAGREKKRKRKKEKGEGGRKEKWFMQVNCDGDGN